jgi:serine acetyltransferase
VVTRDVPAYRIAVGNPARHTGWACECGHKLNDALECPECKTRYALNEGGALAKV